MISRSALLRHGRSQRRSPSFFRLARHGHYGRGITAGLLSTGSGKLLAQDVPPPPPDSQAAAGSAGQSASAAVWRSSASGSNQASYPDQQGSYPATADPGSSGTATYGGSDESTGSSDRAVSGRAGCADSCGFDVSDAGGGSRPLACRPRAMLRLTRLRRPRTRSSGTRA